jgi:5-methylcytosine-specific restriction protein A
MFTKGSEYRRRDLHALYGGQEQGGISTPSNHKMIFLFSSPIGEEYGYKDSWREDGIYLYTGEGQEGDMRFERGNAAIRDHLAAGKELHVFERSQKRDVIYVGQMVFHGFHTRPGSDRKGNIRQIIVFELKLID